jgi:hypothetical protein
MTDLVEPALVRGRQVPCARCLPVTEPTDEDGSEGQLTFAHVEPRAFPNRTYEDAARP